MSGGDHPKDPLADLRMALKALNLTKDAVDQAERNLEDARANYRRASDFCSNAWDRLEQQLQREYQAEREAARA